MQKHLFTDINTILELFLPIFKGATLSINSYITDYQYIILNKTLMNIFSYTFIIVNLH